ncbi:phosphoribosylglycinamide formyltransferase [bacterium]|nr:phosphoribosylglycinamide formyltransferase [bacterium]
MKKHPLRLCVLASGKGSDFLSLIKGSFRPDSGCEIVLMITNNPDAGAIHKAEKHEIPNRCINSKDYTERKEFIDAFILALKEHSVEFIALAGYLRKIPPEIIRAFPNRIVNIHPALLPSFGGKGMYGEAVHRAVLEAGCKISGVTVHFVDEEYDRGRIIAQSAVPVLDDDTTETLAERVLEEEHRLYPEVLSWFGHGRVKIESGRIKILK